MIQLTQITDHADQAEARLLQQYKGKTNIIAGVRMFADEIQELENIGFDIFENGSISKGHDAILDQEGTIVNQARNGLDDDIYKLRLIAKVGENTSRGTPENLIQIFKTLMQADLVYYRPNYPAGMTLTAIGGTPFGSIDDVKQAISASLMGGVSVDLFTSTDAISFSFFGDPDPNGQGFGDFNDGTVGGYLAEVL